MATYKATRYIADVAGLKLEGYQVSRNSFLANSFSAAKAIGLKSYAVFDQ